MIFFDIDETLFDNFGAQDSAAKKFFGVFPELRSLFSESNFPQIWADITEKHLQLFNEHKIPFQQQRRNRINEIFQKNFSNEEADKIFTVYLGLYEESWLLFQDAIPCLDALEHFKLGIISNGDRNQQRQKLRELNICNRFETIVISDDIGVSKPNPEIFQYACHKAKQDPENCYYVGDNFCTDAEAAINAGLRGIWLNRNSQNKDNKRILQITTLHQLPGQVLTAQPARPV